MAREQPLSIEEAKRLRSIFRWAAVIIGLGTVVNLLSGGNPVAVMALHAAWLTWVLGLGELLGRRKIGMRVAGLAASSAAAFFVVPGLVLVSGRQAAPFYLLFICSPLLIASMAPNDRPAVIVSGAGGLLWIVIFEIWGGADLGQLLAWGLFATLCCAIALWGTVLHERSQADRQRAETERLAAVTQLAERERKEARSERLALIGQLAASIAHEVNNPLSFVTANVRYLSEVLGESKPTDDRLDVLRETTEGLERIGNTIRMLQVFVQPNGGPVSGYVQDAVAEATNLLATRLRRVVTPRTTVEEGLPAVALGQRRLVQMIVNLLLNAAEAVKGTSSPQIVVTASREALGLRLVVEDSGGLPPAELPIDPSRAGLGLALCREHVEEVGGTLLVEPRPEGGSRVTVSLPAAPISSTVGA